MLYTISFVSHLAGVVILTVVQKVWKHMLKLDVLISFESHSLSIIMYTWKEMNIFSQQGCIKLINSDGKNILNVTKVFCFLLNSVHLNSLYFSKNPKKLHKAFHKNIKQHNCFQHWI